MREPTTERQEVRKLYTEMQEEEREIGGREKV